MGRPSTYSQETADTICERVANGEALYRVCAQDDMPALSTVYLWLDAHSEFSEKYARAKARLADLRAEEIIAIADEATDPAKARLQVDARKWAASKLAPKKYGDKTVIGGDPDAPVKIESKDMTAIETARRVAFVLAQAGAEMKEPN